MRNQLKKRVLVVPALIVCFCSLGVEQARGQRQDPQPLPIVTGVYRLPYADGTSVSFVNNYTNHPASLHRIDMRGAGAPTTVVAAAAGVIRVIVENNDTFCPDACGTGNDCTTPPDGTADNAAAQAAACGSYNGPSTFCCERHIEANGGVCPSGGTCAPNPNTCTTNVPNNLVWIEHANGEWTKYTHMLRGSIGTGRDNFGNLGAGRVVGEPVAAGTPLGIEGDVGIAGSIHVHFEVAVPNYVELMDELTLANLAEADPERPDDDVGDWFCQGFLQGDGVQDDVLREDKNGDGNNDPDDDVNRQNRITVFCQVGFPVISDIQNAGPCDDLCSSVNQVIQGTYSSTNTPFYDQASATIGNDSLDLVIKPYAGVSIRAGRSVTLTPGFHAETNSFFAASVGSCDSPGGTGE